ncbi:YitT family protein [Candidatus Phytoplasma pini]|uniref:YitT family protein n=1 Tax=Candidatus Phytoplasma pini TaxID=267362 RepID=UPI0016479D5A|nr:YitT family protein [Candidatus Phytoplasma pini]
MKKNNIYKWLFLLVNDFILILTIYFITFGMEINLGGIDGLSLFTTQILKLFPFIDQKINNTEIQIYFMFFYHILSLFLGYKFFGRDFIFKTTLLVLVLNIGCFVLEQKIGKSSLLKTFLIDYIGIKCDFINVIIISILSGFLIGYALSNIYNCGYTTGGLDIIQKILKKYYRINFIIILFLTDGVIICFSSFLTSLEYGTNISKILISILVRIFSSFLSLFIVGFIMEKRILKVYEIISK